MIARPSFRGLMFILCGFLPTVVESADKDEPLVLRGRVIDTSGKPLGGVIVSIRAWPPAVDGAARMPRDVRLGGKRRREIITSTQGYYLFQTPRELDREWIYQARVDPPGREPAETLALSPSVEGKTEFADLVARRVATISGEVVDRQGRGVGGANVFQAGDLSRRCQTTTDTNGRFRLAGVLADPTFLFVTKPGFRFLGARIDGDEQAAALTLTRVEEPADAWHTLPLALANDERVELARRVLEPCLTKAGGEGEGQTAQMLAVLAQIDPTALLARLDMISSEDSFLSGFLKRDAAKALAAGNPDKALAVIGTIDDADFRSMCYLDVVDALGDDQRARKLEMLGEAINVVRGINDPDLRVIQLAETAERFLDLGARDEATKLLREGKKLAEELPQDSFGADARGAFAEELGQIDLPAAMELMKGLTEVSEYDLHHGNLAHELAAKNPAEAERILAMLHERKESNYAWEPRDLWGVRVCYRMASVDLSRARRIAEAMTDPYLKAQAYGLMAQAIAKQQPKTARELIDHAFGVLEKLVDARDATEPHSPTNPATFDAFNGQFSASSLAGSLLPAVEAIDATLVPEYAWRAVSFRLPRVGDVAHQVNARRANAALAMMLARYNREVAEVVFELGRTFGGGRDPGLAALALIDPARAAAAIEEEFDPDHANSGVRAELAELLVMHGDALWQKLNSILGLWSVDVEDEF